MTGIDILVEEHKLILKFTSFLRKLCCEILEGKEIDYATFMECLDFARKYADKHHHGKEEQILFRVMLETLGPVADKLIRNGMLVEHDLGRFYLSELEKALQDYKESPSTEKKLDIISNAIGYAALLQRHIAKEDSVAYPFAERSLSESDKKVVEDETISFEEKAGAKNIQEKYSNWLEQKLNSNE